MFDGVVAGAAACLVLFGALLLGFDMGRRSAGGDCDTFGAVKVSGVIYACTPKKKAE